MPPLPPQYFLINPQILVLKHIENHSFHPVVIFQKFPDRVYGDLRRPSLWETKYPRGNTAKSNTFHAVLCRQFQTFQIAGRQQFFVCRGHCPLDDRADGVKDVFCREVVAGRNFCAAGFFLVPLLCHDLVHFEAELPKSFFCQTCKSINITIPPP